MTLMIAPVVGVPDGGVLPVSFQHVFQDGKLVFSAIIDAPHSAKAREELQLILEELRSLELFTTEEAVHKIRELCKRHESTLTSLAMGLFLENQIIVLTSGGGTVYLSRNQKKGRLLHSVDPHVMGGSAQSGDQYIFLTEQLREKIGEDWKEYDGDPTKIADSISIEILQEQTSARYAGMIVQVGASQPGQDQSGGQGASGDRSTAKTHKFSGKGALSSLLSGAVSTGKLVA